MSRHERIILPASSAANVAATTAWDSASDDDHVSTSGIVAGGTGTLTCRFLDDGADVTVSVIDGNLYPFRLKSCPVGNAVAFVALYNDPS